MEREHIVKSFDKELELLRSKVLEMGRSCEEQLSKAVQALHNRNGALAKEIIEGDIQVNNLQSEIEKLTVQMLAKRQPVAVDLRVVVSSLKIASDFERVADYAANFAKHVIDLNNTELEEPVRLITGMAGVAKSMLNDVLKAFEGLDIKIAIDVWHRDKEVDQLYVDLLTEIRTMMEKDTDSVKVGTTLLFVGRSCERIGDHITNVAENVHYIVNGEIYYGKP